MEAKWEKKSMSFKIIVKQTSGKCSEELMQKGADWKFILQGIWVVIEESLRRIGQGPPPEIVESTLEMDWRPQKNRKIDPAPERNMKTKTNKYL